MNNEINKLKDDLLNAHWPKCNIIAQRLFAIGGDEAKEALLAGLKGKRHHIRSASIKYLGKSGDVSLVSQLEPFLNDSSYETRMETKIAIRELTGKDVLTGRGE
ncbi:MAG: HEAT repeat domain-containing protein [Sporomusaceae bacterium]|nr:HEAT repeat domain-containing protein [Sporomusaceae bacterium]